MTADPLNLREFERIAAERLPQMAWDYYRSGACDELTLARNELAFGEIALRYRVLVDVSRRDTSCELLSRRIALPVLLAPTAFHKLAHPDGELASARAASAAGTTMVLSTLSTTPVEDVVAAASCDVWFQLYVYRDRGATTALVERVRAAGCKALVLTVDAPLLGCRERDVRNSFALPEGLAIENASAERHRSVRASDGGSGLAGYFAEQLDPALTWKDLEWLRSIAGLPVLVKGVVRADDARRAVEHGADGVIVSNHGGRQLDTALASIEALPDVAAEIGGELPILVDGGVRRGTDVIKALALGASAVLLGRPVLWGLAAAGEQGVTKVLTLLRREFDLAMALCGCPTVSDITHDLIVNSPNRGPQT
jgi:4-hydroxymandelate oxidase